MTDFLSNHVRPTYRFLRDLGLSFPELGLPIWEISHPLIAHMQKVPGEVIAGGAEPIRSLTDRVWWKCKTANLRGTATALTETECIERDLDTQARWWGGAAGMRRADSATDFYRQIQAEAVRHGRGTGAVSTRHLLPQAIDAERLQAETAILVVQALRAVVLDLVARSLHDGRAYTAILTGHNVTALVRADNGAEAYLAVVAEGFIHPKMIAIILSRRKSRLKSWPLPTKESPSYSAVVDAPPACRWATGGWLHHEVSCLADARLADVVGPWSRL